MMRAFPFLCGLLVVAATAWPQGLWTQRWQKSGALEAAVQRLHDAPGNLGAWKAEPVALEADALADAGAKGSWLRRYTDKRSGASVSILLMCGRSGKMSVHRPEHCYRGAGFEIVGDPQSCTIAGDPSAHCWTARFRKQESTGSVRLRIFWTWFADGAWQAPNSPRLTFAHLPALYKLYAIRELSPRAERLEQDPTLELLQLLLPALQQTLTHP